MEYFFNFDKIAYLKGDRPAGCILCLIAGHDPGVENLSIYEDDLYTISLNLYPYNPGHCLIFPNRHVEDIRDLSCEEEAEYGRILKMLLDALTSTHSPTGFNIGLNMGLDAGASINHLHYHVIPRYPREMGIADLIAGKRVLVENPMETALRLKTEIGKRVNLARA